MEDNFDEKQPVMEDDPWLKTTFYGRRLLIENYFHRRQSLKEEDLWLKTTSYKR